MCLISYDEVRIELWFKIFCEKLEKELANANSINELNSVVFIIESLNTLTKEDQARVLRLFESITKMLYGHVSYPLMGTKKLFNDYMVIVNDDFLDLGNPVTYPSFIM